MIRSARLAWMLLLPALLAAAPVTGYRMVTGLGRAAGGATVWVVLRSGLRPDGPFLLAVDPDTLQTKLLPAASLQVEPLPIAAIASRLAGTPYVKALRDDVSRDQALQDAGITRGAADQGGVDLTVDLCPSLRPLDRGLFAAVFAEFGRVEAPVPVAVSLSGVWLEKHGADLRWLLEQERRGRIAVTWVNHTYHHRTSRRAPLRLNFMLEPGTDVDFEVLETERRMIELGLCPSVFFRFPGLVSDPALFVRIAGYGLIPVGSDAWLGKNEWPTPGSIVLVHANGNEPLGIRRFLALVRSRRAEIGRRRWLLFDLRDSVRHLEQETR